MRYRRQRDADLGARVPLFVKGPTVLALDAEGLGKSNVAISTPVHWISAATFLASDGGVHPDTVVLHVANEAARVLSLSSVRLWLPKEGATWQTLWPQPPMRVVTEIPPRDNGFLKLRTNKLPLTYVAIEAVTNVGPVWAHLRIKRETFDISGGWVGGNLTSEPYLRLLHHLHVNTGHFDNAPGYADNPVLYDRYPLRLFNRLWPLEKWDAEARRIHRFRPPNGGRTRRRRCSR
ncbi:MAG: hypothetical protein NTU53_11395 [Planctomycetota bacterium]|nr:hypothetical protein [Planctomycetota bacterium]